jgi:hypothetical protein
MLPYECETCEDTGRYSDFRGGRGGRITMCDHKATTS